MAGKKGKSGNGAGPGKIGVRDGKEKGGKKRLAEVVERQGSMIGEYRALVKRGDGAYDLLEDMVRDGDFWTNGSVRIRCGKKGLEDSSWKVGEDEEMVDTFDGKVVKKEKVVEEAEVEEGEGMEVDSSSEEEEEEERKCIKEVGKGKGKEVEVVDLSSGSEVGSGVGLIDAWKEEKIAKERREREEKKRETEGMISRGKDRGMGRKEVLEMKQMFGDYEEVVGDVGYVLGIDVGLARCFVMDREIRKVVEMMVSGDSEARRDIRRMSEGAKKEEVVVMSKVVMEEGLREREELERLSGVNGGRTYGEVLRGVGSGVAEGEEVTEKLEEERMKWVEEGIEREKRSGKVVEVVMDSQGEKSEKEWKKEEIVKELGVAEGTIEKVVVNGNRVKMVMKDNDVAEGVEKAIVNRKKEIMGGGVVEVKRNEKWVGLVVPGMSVDMWEGRMEELKSMIEVENDIKLMRMPRWLANEDRRKALGLKSVGVVVHVARESVRVKLVEEGLKYDDRIIQVKRYVEEKQLVFCTKCAMVGHNWWQCERKKLRCSVCAVEGHAGWMHRCERCKVQRKGCEHYRKCAMCGKAHTVAEVREGNCLGVRAEMMRLRSLNY